MSRKNDRRSIECIEQLHQIVPVSCPVRVRLRICGQGGEAMAARVARKDVELSGQRREQRAIGFGVEAGCMGKVEWWTVRRPFEA